MGLEVSLGATSQFETPWAKAATLRYSFLAGATLRTAYMLICRVRESSGRSLV